MLSFVLAATCLLGAADVQLQTLDGETISGSLKSLGADAIVIAAESGERAIAPGQVLQITPQAGDGPAVHPLRQFQVDLTDGSQLQTAGFKSSDSRVTLQLDEQRNAEVPQTAVRTLRMTTASEQELAQWKQIVDENQAGDRIVVRKQGALDQVEGVLHDVTPENVQFEVDGETISVKWTKIFGLIYQQRAGDQAPSALCRVYLADGSQLAAREIALADNALTIKLASGASLEVPLATLERLDYSRGKIAYLSDLAWDARESQRVPFLGPALPLDSELDLFSPQRDRAFAGGPLRLGGHSHAKGLALHSRTRLVYRLPDSYRRFVALVGIDERVGSRGNAALRIEGDDKILFEQTLTGPAEPVAVDVDVSGVRRLTIFVDYGQDQDISDHVDLCEARLIK